MLAEFHQKIQKRNEKIPTRSGSYIHYVNDGQIRHYSTVTPILCYNIHNFWTYHNTNETKLHYMFTYSYYIKRVCCSRTLVLQ